MKKMVCVIACVVLALEVWARDEPLALGFGVSEQAGNLGVSLELSSPSFLGGFLTVRAETQLDFLSAYRDAPEIAWDAFSSERIGLAGTGGWCGDEIRLYGEFGALFVLPPSDLTDDSVQAGIYGLFGFEFFLSPDTGEPIAFYLEAGTNSLFADAERLPGKPDYYSGFTTRTGLRYYFR
jgi:hypothetical protein